MEEEVEEDEEDEERPKPNLTTRGRLHVARRE